MGVRAVETITASVNCLSPVKDAAFAWLHRKRSSALLRVSHQMIGGIAELDVDRAYSLEVMADVQFVAHAHAAMQLPGLLGVAARGIADLRLGAGRQLRPIRLPRRQTQVQMLGERNRLLQR